MRENIFSNPYDTIKRDVIYATLINNLFVIIRNINFLDLRNQRGRREDWRERNRRREHGHIMVPAKYDYANPIAR